MFSQWICMSVNINHYTQSISEYMYTEWMAPFNPMWLKFANVLYFCVFLFTFLHIFL